MNFNLKYTEYLNYFEENLENSLNLYKNFAQESIFNGVKYATEKGGKRIRPVLCLAVADMLNIPLKSVVNYAIAIELIHSYSLVHDDLPAMDNDDFRRGKPSTHKKFGEAMGILIGDALLNMAFDLLMSTEDYSLNSFNAIRKVSSLAGIKGMIDGQVLDINSANIKVDQKSLYEIYQKKTCNLLIAPVLVPSILKDSIYYNQLEEFALNLGYLFQITDDILDEEGDSLILGKSVGKDKKDNKLTAIKVFGLNGAKIKAKEHYLLALDILNNLPNSNFLIELTNKLYERKK